ncbi:I78 family peptidase inhibitor [Luteimonas deserti]|uniref:Elastase inhibitor AFLEI Flags n=1 Tax=Luteimonas deserti TaxID=2752306 RepID=A0A7Z0QMI9_9GAMM|nr:I78 family peptidase inhibitor [Luteimonas deserti]NYZ61392.1 Elastase inhibitor AFLEI Flags: Precursor [Luteimonas deserti]
MSPRPRLPLPRALHAAFLVPVLLLAACAPAQDEAFEEEPPAAGVADADTGAGSPIETEAAPADPVDGPATPGAAAATPCDTEAVQALIGQAGSEALYERAMREAGARQYRALGPTDAATMDFREDRLNIDLDAGGAISGFRCG